MPALITHDFFGRDVYDELFGVIGGSRDEADAFLLGNQGPDPLFFSVLDLGLREHNKLGTTMHKAQPSRLLASMKRSLGALDDRELGVGRAYAFGFLCHYLLDSNEHPLVYSQQFAICDAGVPGLSREDGTVVHAVIESEWDELVLFAKRGETVATFNPSKEILHASDEVLDTISKMIAFVAFDVYGEVVPLVMFARSVKLFRFVHATVYSPTGTKRQVLGDIECLARRHSFVRAFTSQPVARETSDFDNHERRPWENPFTHAVSTEGFWDIYSRAQELARAAIPAFDQPDFGEDVARLVTGGINFDGQPAEASIVSVHDAAACAACDAAGFCPQA